MENLRHNTDLIAIADRMKNLARGKSGERDLMPAGVVLCNMTAHFMAELYGFAEQLDWKNADALCEIVRKWEKLPASIIEIANPDPDLSS